MRERRIHWSRGAVALGMIGISSLSYASEWRELYRGARAMAMGNASVAIVEDEQAVFFNPAGLAGNKSFALHYAIADIEASGDLALSLLNNPSAFTSFSVNSINTLSGTHIYGRAQLTPTLMLPNLGIALMMDDQVSLISLNQVFPQVNIGYQFTNGFQAAYGFSLLRKNQRAKRDIRVGVGAKLMWRRGGYRTVSIPELIEKNQAIVQDIATTFERGIGFDLGFQYIHNVNSNLRLSFGTAWTDMGDTNFGTASDPQRNNLSLGVAGTYKFGKMAATLAYDHRHVLDEGDWRKRSHFGAELALPFVSFMAGLNQANLTYGASVDLWLVKVTALTYAEELGTLVGQDRDRRYLLHLGLKFSL